MSRVLAVLLLASAKAAQAQLKCATGWNDEVKVIPPEWINDGYCDCPLDGSDEPDTEACSGSVSWPGIDTPDERYVQF